MTSRFYGGQLDYIAQLNALNGIRVPSSAAAGVAASAVTAWRDALAAVPAGGGLVYVEDGDYLLDDYVQPKSNTTIILSPGARIIAASNSPLNIIFAFAPSVAPTGVALTSAAQGATQITVASTSTFVVGQRVIVSAGPFTGPVSSGAEEGPIQFATVVSVDDATHLTLDAPMRYDFVSGFSMLTGQSPVCYPLTDYRNNIRIHGGRMCAKSIGDTPRFFFTAYCEDCEISGMLFEEDVANGYYAFGSALVSGTRVSGLHVVGNRVRGRAGTSAPAGSNVGINIGSMVCSVIERNHLEATNEDTTASNRAFNHIVIESGCTDNVIADNIIGPVRATNVAAIEYTLCSFNNRISRNRISGVMSDVTAGNTTLGIRGNCFAGLPGSVIDGNNTRDLATHIYDVEKSTAIFGNLAENTTLFTGGAYGTVGIMGYTDSVLPLMNGFRNLAHPTRKLDGTTGAPIIYGGTGAPTDDVGLGSVYAEYGAGAGDAIWFRDLFSGSGAWYRRSQLPIIPFASLPGAASNGGTLYWVPDGTPGSNPLVGGGGGAIAISNGTSYRGI